VADDPPIPRRRVTDQERRRWNDTALDLLREDLEDVQSEQRAIAALYRRLAPIPNLLEQYMKTTDARLDRMHNIVEKVREENRTAHRNIAYGKDPEDGEKQLPPQPATLTWGAVAKIATILAAFFAPTAALVAAVIAVLGGQ
jgi:hypothetical protein